MSRLRDLLRRGARQLGIEGSPIFLRLKRFYPRASDFKYLATQLLHNHVNVVFDIGANVGQFARELRLGGYRGRIVSFEPLSAAHARLVRTSRGDPNWIVAPRMAIGNCDSSVDLNIAGDSVSSSVLEMLDVHVNAAPDSVYVGRERTDIRKLDSVAGEFLRPGDKLFVKADVQGGEAQVLDGARNLFPRIAGLCLELALVPCYKGQASFEQVLKELEARGFSLWLLSPGTVEEHTGRQLQVDAVFFRRQGADAGRSDSAAESRAAVYGSANKV